jgi:threonine dehydrogenase-like Zn-dependent dehydrogenase
VKIRPLSVPGFASARLSPLMAGTLGLLVLVALAAAGFATYALVGPQSEAAQSAARDWKPPTLAIVELEPPKPASADVQTLTRPIFSKNRKPSTKAPTPAPAAAAAIEATVAAPTGLTLAAIVKHGGVSSAFIISAGAPDGVWKKVGETVESWTVAAITDLELTLKNGEQAVKLRLFADPPQ